MDFIILKDFIFKKIGKFSENEIVFLNKVHNHFNKNSTIDLNKELFNEIHIKEKQKLLGITYTPPEIRIELTNSILNNYKNIKDLKIIDPCCGSGLFTITLINEITKRKYSHNFIKDNIYFNDIDRISVAISVINITNFLERQKIKFDINDLNCSCEDFFHLDNSYDIFITNPPYIKLQNLALDRRDFLKKKYPNLSKGALGLSVFFIKRMFDKLKIGGMIGVITQNNIFTSNAGVNFRTELQPFINKILTFGSSGIFKDVTTYTCLLYLTKSKNSEFSYAKLMSENIKNIKYEMISNNKLNPHKWRLGNSKELENLSKLESAGIPLNKVCNISVGIATQFDKAFTVFKNEGNWYGHDERNNKYVIERDVIKPLIKISSINCKDDIENNNRGIIFPYFIENNKVTEFEEGYFLEKYPNAYSYLSIWKERLLKRQSGKVKNEDWFKWGRIQSMIPKKNKILTKTFNKGPSFILDTTDSLFSNGYAIQPILKNYDITFIHMILNSYIFEYYVKLTSFEIGGEYQCFQKNFIENFTIPIIDLQDQILFTKDKSAFDTFLINYYDLQMD